MAQWAAVHCAQAHSRRQSLTLSRSLSLSRPWAKSAPPLLGWNSNTMPLHLRSQAANRQPASQPRKRTAGLGRARSAITARQCAMEMALHGSENATASQQPAVGRVNSASAKGEPLAEATVAAVVVGAWPAVGRDNFAVMFRPPLGRPGRAGLRGPRLQRAGLARAECTASSLQSPVASRPPAPGTLVRRGAVWPQERRAGASVCLFLRARRTWAGNCKPAGSLGWRALTS